MAGARRACHGAGAREPPPCAGHVHPVPGRWARGRASGKRAVVRATTAGYRVAPLGCAGARWEGDSPSHPPPRSLGIQLSSARARHGVWPLRARARAVWRGCGFLLVLDAAGAGPRACSEAVPQSLRHRGELFPTKEQQGDQQDTQERLHATVKQMISFLTQIGHASRSCVTTPAGAKKFHMLLDRLYLLLEIISCVCHP